MKWNIRPLNNKAIFYGGNIEDYLNVLENILEQKLAVDNNLV